MSLNLFTTLTTDESTPVAMPASDSQQQPDTASASSATPCHLYFATDLSRLDYAGPEDDILLDQRVYRRLTPDYYAWLRSRMEMVSRKHARGLLPDANYQAIRDRFNAMHDDAVTLLGEERLLKALATCNPDRYLPPMREYAAAVPVDVHGRPLSPETASTQVASDSPFAPGRTVCARDGAWHAVVTRAHPADEYFPCGWVDVLSADGTPGQADVRYLVDPQGRPLIEQMIYTEYERQAIELARNERPEDFDDLEASLPILSFPVSGDWRFEESPSFEDYLKVNDIRERALMQGWSDAELFRTCSNLAFPYGQDYGLVCFVHGCAIGEITADGIALQSEKPGGATLTFHRPHRTAQEG